MSTQESMREIAVIGGGVAGLTAAHILQRRYRVTIFERNDYLGGHTHTIELPAGAGADAGVPVDTGFIVCNDHTYPLFHRLLGQLGVSTRSSNMSFSYTDPAVPFFYAGTNLNGLFAQRRNLLRPGFWSFLAEIRRFCAEGLRALEQNAVPPVSIGEYVTRGQYSRQFMDWYLVPMMAAIWSTPPGEVTAFPAEALLRFFRNHGLLSLRDRPQWQTVTGGSHAYVKAFQKQFNGAIRLATPVRQVRRAADGVWLSLDAGGPELRFDGVVMAAHADETFAMLADPDAAETRLLGPWHYERNRVVLHSDPAALPPVRRAWASWNYVREEPGAAADLKPVSVTYYMNLLQGLQTRKDYCVSLNRRRPIAPESIIRELEYAHPTYSFASMSTQAGLPQLNGRRQTWFCGSYFSYGFHEDAVRSAVAVGRDLGLEL